MKAFKVIANVPSRDGKRIEVEIYGVAATDIAQAALKFIKAFPDGEVLEIIRVGDFIE